MFFDVETFDTTIPSGTSLRSQGDDEIRRMKTLIDGAMEEEHFFFTAAAVSASSRSGGIHRPGSSRISFGTADAPLTDDEGRLYFDIDDGLLILQGSSATTVITGSVSGAAGTLLHGHTTTFGQNLASGVSSNLSLTVIESGLAQWNTTVEEYEAPIAGIYEFSASVRINSNLTLAAGQNLTFSWEMDDGGNRRVGLVEKHGDTEMADRSFNISGSAELASSNSVRLIGFQDDTVALGVFVEHMLIKRIGASD